jgi:hypothetical protein
MGVAAGLTRAGTIAPANAPAMAFNDVRLAMFGADGLALTSRLP